MYYIETASGPRTIKNFDPQVIDAVYKSKGLSIADLVLRGSDAEGEYLYDSENGWVLDALTDRELSALRAAFKNSSKSLRLVVGE